MITKYSKTKKIIKEFLKSESNFIKKIVRIDNFNDYPKFYQYTIISEDESASNLNINALSHSKNQAYIKCFFEGIERYILINFNNKNFVIDTYKNLKLKHKVIDPNSFYHLPVSKDFRNLQLKWLKAKNLITDEEALIPAQLIYFPKNHNEPLIRFPDTQGAAAHLSINEALLHAILELIERETFALFFYYDRKAFLINNLSLKKTKLKFLLEYINRYLFDIKLLLIENRWSIPVVLSLIIDKKALSEKLPSLISGIACDFSLEKAIEKAIYEAFQSINGLRELILVNNQKIIKKLKKTSPIVERLLWWANYKNLRYLKVFLTKKLKSKVNIQTLNYSYLKNLKTTEEKISFIKKKAVMNKVEIFWVKTFSWNKKIYALKVVSSDILPLSLSYKYTYCQKNKEGLIIKPKKNWPFPHFIP